MTLVRTAQTPASEARSDTPPTLAVRNLWKVFGPAEKRLKSIIKKDA